jgi:outer membrane beta-barrel protein
VRLRLSAALSLCIPLAAALLPETGLAYQKAVDTNEVVMDKLFPKKGKTELDVDAGVVLNSSYVQTFLVGASLTYYWSEEWGFGVTASAAVNQDKPERQCIESFYNDPNFALDSQCGDTGTLTEDPQGDANMGPAYVPIREPKYILTGDFVWNPIYGKQIVLLSATNYFDFYFKFGGGLTMSQYYPEQQNFPDGHPQRGTFCTKQTQKAGGCTPPAGGNPGTTDDNLFGVAGRPVPLSENNVTLHLAVGQRFHFFKRFLIEGSLEDYTLVGTEQSYDNFLVIKGGFGVRF